MIDLLKHSGLVPFQDFPSQYTAGEPSMTVPSLHLNS